MEVNRKEAQIAADHWAKLAKAQDDLAAHYESVGLPFGDVSSYRHRAETYRATARALYLEAETGRPHCSICFGDHSNHEHAHRG